MIKKISDKDQKDWENFIKSSDKLENKDIENDNLITNNEKTLDLHGFNLRDANIAVGKLIISSYNQGVKKINIITGKGMRSKNKDNPYSSEKFGILKFSVPDYISNQKDLMDKIIKINMQDVENLNAGKFSIYLKKKK